MKQKLERLEDRGFVFDIHDEVNELYDRSQDGSKVRNAIVSLREHEYDDDLYTGVPESALERQLGERTASAGIEWLLRIGDLHRESDGSLVLVT
jgi:hypothetical protein